MDWGDTSSGARQRTSESFRNFCVPELLEKKRCRNLSANERTLRLTKYHNSSMLTILFSLFDHYDNSFWYLKFCARADPRGSPGKRTSHWNFRYRDALKTYPGWTWRKNYRLAPYLTQFPRTVNSVGRHTWLRVEIANVLRRRRFAVTPNVAGRRIEERYPLEDVLGRDHEDEEQNGRHDDAQ